MPVNKKTVYTISTIQGCWLEVRAAAEVITIQGFWADGSENGEIELAYHNSNLPDLVAALLDIQMNNKTKENI